MFISFAWTTDPFLADAKDMTRRYWTIRHAMFFRKGMIVDAYDRLPHRKGKKIGEIKILKKPYPQPTGQMTEEDFKREGLEWMQKNNQKIKGQDARAFFEEWKQKNDTVWVLEFEKLPWDKSLSKQQTSLF